MTLEIDNKNIELLKDLPKNVKEVHLKGEFDIKYLCDILEDTKPSIKIINDKLTQGIEEEFKKRGTFQGFNKSILNTVKKICKDNVSLQDYTVDMTIGNGNDTLYLASISKFVFGFDIQKQAIENTETLLNSNNISNYQLFMISHSNIDEVLTKYKRKIKLFLFNLGYLPNGDKTITTNHQTTLEALKKSIEYLTKDGLILIVFYPHPEGRLEASHTFQYLWINNIKYQVYKNTTNKDAPYLVVISPYS